MNVMSSVFKGKSNQSKRVVIFILSGFLIAYHVVKLYNLYIIQSEIDYSMLVHIQSLLRMAIVISLLFVILGKQKAIFGMWMSIFSLVVTQYMAHFTVVEPIFSIFSYLKGFIFPTLITLLFLYKKPRRNTNL